MVRQVKIVVCLVAILCCICGLTATTQAATYDIYDGNPSNTYIQYYKDIISGLPITKNYVVFRSGQNEYNMVVGDIVENNGLFTSDSECEVYTFSQRDSSYNGYYQYHTSTIDSFVLDSEDKIVYSDVGGYPELVERGAKFEILSVVLIVCIIVGFVCRNIFYHRPR